MKLLNLSVLLFFSICVISLSWAFNPWLATNYLIIWGFSIILFFLVQSLNLKPLSVFWVGSLAALGIAGIGLIQYYRLCPFFLGDIFNLAPPSATLSNRNMAANWIGPAIWMSAGAVYLTKRYYLKLIPLVSIVLSVWYLLISTCRTDLMALALILLGLSARELLKYYRRLAIVAVVASLCVLYVYKPDISAYLHKGATLKLRSVWALNGIEMIKDRPLLGVGLGNFKIMYPPYHEKAAHDWSFSENAQANRLHDDNLQMFVELGFVGGLAWLMIFFAFFRQVYKVRTPAAYFSGLYVLAWFIMAWFSFPMERACHVLYLFLNLGLVGCKNHLPDVGKGMK